MKHRSYLVSNSSSTSFMVSKDRKDEAIKMGLTLIPISDLKNWLKQADDLGIDFLMTDSSIRWKINELEDNGGYITSPYDRDRAYTEGIDFPAFEEDL